MRGKLLFLVIISALTAGCAKETPAPATTPPSAQQAGPPPTPSTASPVTQAAAADSSVKPKLDACGLLTSAEIQSVQGEAPKETKLSAQNAGGLAISQCFYTLPTFSNSVSLIVAHKAEGAGAREPKEFWRSTFKERRENRKEEKAEREEEETQPPKRVAGIGEEAFWTGNRVAGALYVLKGDAYVRVSVGGSSDKARQTQAKALAQKAVARL